MKAPTRLRLASSAALLWLAGCGHSPPTRFLVLDVAPPPSGLVRAGYRGPPVSIIAVQVPAVLDRPEFAREVSPGQLQINDFERWSAPLGTLARDTLGRDLTLCLPDGAVLPVGAGFANAGVIRIEVVVVSFGTGTDGTSMEASYRLLLPGGGDLRRQARFRVPSDGIDAAASARAWTALLGKLAEHIAVELPAK